MTCRIDPSGSVKQIIKKKKPIERAISEEWEARVLDYRRFLMKKWLFLTSRLQKISNEKNGYFSHRFYWIVLKSHKKSDDP